MILAKPLSLFLTLSFIIIVDLQAQVGEKYYGRASYYADKFHGRSTSSGEIYDRAEYTAAHRNLPFNTIVEVINTKNNRIAVVKINDRGPFAYNRMLDLSFAAAKDLELLGPGEADIEMKILSMDKAEYSIPSFFAGEKGEFNRKFTQYDPIEISGNKGIKATLDTSFMPHKPTANSLQPKPVAETFVVADSLRRQQAEGDKMGFRQHKYIRVIKDGDGHYRLDSSIVTPPTPQEVYSVASQNKNFNSSNPHPVISKVQPQIIATDTNTAVISINESVKEDIQVAGFRQHKYVSLYTDSEGRIRMDTTQKAPFQLAKITEKQNANIEAKPEVLNVNLPNVSSNIATKKTNTQEATKPKVIYKDGFRQHAYIKLYKDKDGKTRLDTTSFERPK